jgi:hypothetical protein
VVEGGHTSLPSHPKPGDTHEPKNKAQEDKEARERQDRLI